MAVQLNNNIQNMEKGFDAGGSVVRKNVRLSRGKSGNLLNLQEIKHAN